MKRALIGAVAVAAFATPALAQAVVEDPGYCAQFYPDANCQNLGPGNPYTDGGYWQGGNAMAPGYAMQSVEPDAPRYHGGPKSND
jgi:opacity protein-like surface antigen